MRFSTLNYAYYVHGNSISFNAKVCSFSSDVYFLVFFTKNVTASKEMLSRAKGGFLCLLSAKHATVNILFHPASFCARENQWNLHGEKHRASQLSTAAVGKRN